MSNAEFLYSIKKGRDSRIFQAQDRANVAKTGAQYGTNCRTRDIFFTALGDRPGLRAPPNTSTRFNLHRAISPSHELAATLGKTANVFERLRGASPQERWIATTPRRRASRSRQGWR